MSNPTESSTGRPPQGITPRFMATNDYRRDVHPRHKKPMIDPASLTVNGEPPFLALPIPESTEVRIRQVNAATAARMLTCDEATGGASVYRLATDEEVAAYHAAAAARRPAVERSFARDERRRENS